MRHSFKHHICEFACVTIFSMAILICTRHRQTLILFDACEAQWRSS